MPTAWLLISLLVNGVLVPGTQLDGWGPRPMKDMETCERRKNDLYAWKKKVLPRHTAHGLVTDITAECVPANAP